MALAEMDAAEKPAKNLTDRDVLRLLNAADGVTDCTGKRMHSFVEVPVDWCRDEVKHIETNPYARSSRARNQRPQDAPQSRSEYLEPAARLLRLWRRAGKDHLNEPVWRDLVRFLIALPCRRGEATTLDWAHLDLKKAEWRQPEKLTKNRDPHRLYLHPLALEVLEDAAAGVGRNRGFLKAYSAKFRRRLPRKGVPRSGLVFPSPRSNDEIDTFTMIKAKMVAATKPPKGETGETSTGVGPGMTSAGHSPRLLAKQASLKPWPMPC